MFGVGGDHEHLVAQVSDFQDGGRVLDAAELEVEHDDAARGLVLHGEAGDGVGDGAEFDVGGFGEHAGDGVAVEGVVFDHPDVDRVNSRAHFRTRPRGPGGWPP